MWQDIRVPVFLTERLGLVQSLRIDLSDIPKRGVKLGLVLVSFEGAGRFAEFVDLRFFDHDVPFIR